MVFSVSSSIVLEKKKKIEMQLFDEDGKIVTRKHKTGI